MPRFVCNVLVYESDPETGEAYNIRHLIKVNARDIEDAKRKALREVREYYSPENIPPGLEYSIEKVKCKLIG